MERSPKKAFINGLIDSSIDPEVYQDLRQTFARETISFMPYGNLSITNVNSQLINRVQFTETEISPFHKNDIPCQQIERPAFQRQPSTFQFAAKKIDFSLLQQLLTHSFSPQNAVNRPYPSAGGLYPVEPLIFLFAERCTNFPKPDGCYHFRPLSKNLQLIKKIDLSFFYQKMLYGFADSPPEQWPNFAILYLAHLGKAIFKYRHRGYRHALMEAGAMYQQATVVSQAHKLRTTVWSTFSEQQMLYHLSLDHGTYLPLTVQLFGYGE